MELKEQNSNGNLSAIPSAGDLEDQEQKKASKLVQEKKVDNQYGRFEDEISHDKPYDN